MKKEKRNIKLKRWFKTGVISKEQYKYLISKKSMPIKAKPGECGYKAGIYKKPKIRIINGLNTNAM